MHWGNSYLSLATSSGHELPLTFMPPQEQITTSSPPLHSSMTLGCHHRTEQPVSMMARGVEGFTSRIIRVAGLPCPLESIAWAACPGRPPSPLGVATVRVRKVRINAHAEPFTPVSNPQQVCAGAALKIFVAALTGVARVLIQAVSRRSRWAVRVAAVNHRFVPVAQDRQRVCGTPCGRFKAVAVLGHLDSQRRHSEAGQAAADTFQTPHAVSAASQDPPASSQVPQGSAGGSSLDAETPPSGTLPLQVLPPVPQPSLPLGSLPLPDLAQGLLQTFHSSSALGGPPTLGGASTVGSAMPLQHASWTGTTASPLHLQQPLRPALASIGAVNPVFAQHALDIQGTSMQSAHHHVQSTSTSEDTAGIHSASPKHHLPQLLGLGGPYYGADVQALLQHAQRGLTLPITGSEEHLPGPDHMRPQNATEHPRMAAYSASTAQGDINSPRYKVQRRATDPLPSASEYLERDATAPDTAAALLQGATASSLLASAPGMSLSYLNPMLNIHGDPGYEQQQLPLGPPPASPQHPRRHTHPQESNPLGGLPAIPEAPLSLAAYGKRRRAVQRPAQHQAAELSPLAPFAAAGQQPATPSEQRMVHLHSPSSLFQRMQLQSAEQAGIPSPQAISELSSDPTVRGRSSQQLMPPPPSHSSPQNVPTGRSSEYIMRDERPQVRPVADQRSGRRRRGLSSDQLLDWSRRAADASAQGLPEPAYPLEADIPDEVREWHDRQTQPLSAVARWALCNMQGLGPGATERAGRTVSGQGAPNYNDFLRCLDDSTEQASARELAGQPPIHLYELFALPLCLPTLCLNWNPPPPSIRRQASHEDGAGPSSGAPRSRGTSHDGSRVGTGSGSLPPLHASESIIPEAPAVTQAIPSSTAVLFTALGAGSSSLPQELSPALEGHMFWTLDEVNSVLVTPHNLAEIMSRLPDWVSNTPVPSLAVLLGLRYYRTPADVFEGVRQPLPQPHPLQPAPIPPFGAAAVDPATVQPFAMGLSASLGAAAQLPQSALTTREGTSSQLPADEDAVKQIVMKAAQAALQQSTAPEGGTAAVSPLFVELARCLRGSMPNLAAPAAAQALDTSIVPTVQDGARGTAAGAAAVRSEDDLPAFAAQIQQALQASTCSMERKQEILANVITEKLTQSLHPAQARQHQPQPSPAAAAAATLPRAAPSLRNPQAVTPKAPVRTQTPPAAAGMPSTRYHQPDAAVALQQAFNLTSPWRSSHAGIHAQHVPAGGIAAPHASTQRPHSPFTTPDRTAVQAEPTGGAASGSSRPSLAAVNLLAALQQGGASVAAPSVTPAASAGSLEMMADYQATATPLVPRVASRPHSRPQSVSPASGRAAQGRRPRGSGRSLPPLHQSQLQRPSTSDPDSSSPSPAIAIGLAAAVAAAQEQMFAGLTSDPEAQQHTVNTVLTQAAEQSPVTTTPAAAGATTPQQITASFDLEQLQSQMQASLAGTAVPQPFPSFAASREMSRERSRDPSRERDD